MSDFDDIDEEIKRLMRGKSASLSIDLPSKSLLDIAMEKLQPAKDEEERVHWTIS